MQSGSLLQLLQTLALGTKITVIVKSGACCCKQTGVLCKILDEYIILIDEDGCKMYIKVAAIASIINPAREEEGLKCTCEVSMERTEIWIGNFLEFDICPDCSLEDSSLRFEVDSYIFELEEIIFLACFENNLFLRANLKEVNSEEIIEFLLMANPQEISYAGKGEGRLYTGVDFTSVEFGECPSEEEVDLSCVCHVSSNNFDICPNCSLEDSTVDLYYLSSLEEIEFISCREETLAVVGKLVNDITGKIMKFSLMAVPWSVLFIVPGSLISASAGFDDFVSFEEC